MAKWLMREPEVCQTLACGPTTLDEEYVKTGRLRWVYPTKRTKAAVSDEVFALVDEIVRERDAGVSKLQPQPWLTQSSGPATQERTKRQITSRRSEIVAERDAAPNLQTKQTTRKPPGG